jgi:hypothetical protein
MKPGGRLEGDRRPRAEEEKDGTAIQAARFGRKRHGVPGLLTRHSVSRDQGRIPDSYRTFHCIILPEPTRNSSIVGFIGEPNSMKILAGRRIRHI